MHLEYRVHVVLQKVYDRRHFVCVIMVMLVEEYCCSNKILFKWYKITEHYWQYTCGKYNIVTAARVTGCATCVLQVHLAALSMLRYITPFYPTCVSFIPTWVSTIVLIEAHKSRQYLSYGINFLLEFTNDSTNWSLNISISQSSTDTLHFKVYIITVLILCFALALHWVR